MGHCVFLWFYMVFYGFIYFLVVLKGFICFLVVLYVFYMVAYGFTGFFVILYGFIWFYTVYMVLYARILETKAKQKPFELTYCFCFVWKDSTGKPRHSKPRHTLIFQGVVSQEVEEKHHTKNWR